MNALSHHQISILNGSMAAVLGRLDPQRLRSQRLFITGGTGFFGLWLLTALLALQQKGISIEVCVLSRDPASFLQRHPQFRDQPWLSFICGNIRDFAIPDRRFDLLLHAATETSMAAHANPIEMFDDIVMGTRHILNFAKSCGVRRMLLISSGAVYGQQQPHVPLQPDQSMLICNPQMPSNAYGEGKRVMELMGAMHHQFIGIECIAARCYSFCAPGLPIDGHYAVGNFVRDALFAPEITVQGDGTPVRSYLYGADLAVWLLSILSHGKAGESYNVGSDTPISIKNLAFKVRDLLSPGKRVNILQSPSTSLVERQQYVPSIKRARTLGCWPWTSLDASIRHLADFHSIHGTD